MGTESTSRLTAVSHFTTDREAVLGNWIGGSLGRLLQVSGQAREGIQPRVRVESVWAALGDRAAPVTIVRWREESRADLVP